MKLQCYLCETRGRHNIYDVQLIGAGHWVCNQCKAYHFTSPSREGIIYVGKDRATAKRMLDEDTRIVAAAVNRTEDHTVRVPQWKREETTSPFEGNE